MQKVRKRLCSGRNSDMKRSFKEAQWYPYAVAACIAVLLYVVLTHLASVWGGVATFVGFFRAVIYGVVIAYLVNPLAVFLNNKVLKKIGKEKSRWALSGVLAFVIVLLVLSLVIILLIPQLIDSIKTFANNLDGYIASLNRLLESIGLSGSKLGLGRFLDSSEGLLNTLSDMITDNLDGILETGLVAGKSLVSIAIGVIFSVYMLLDKENLKAGCCRLLRAVCGHSRYDRLMVFLNKCHGIFNRYIVFNLIDCLIIGIANFIFMTVLGMEYAGMISVIVALTNLIPTFGPIVGGVLGAFILLMVRPFHALLFLAFTVGLQFLDGYVIKPRLFGNTLGVSGLFILIGVVVGGNMFGILGILLAIPVVAIIDLIYSSYLMPWLEGRRQKETATPASDAGSETAEVEDGTQS